MPRLGRPIGRAGRVALVLLLLAGVARTTSRARAQTEDVNTAEALFDQGRKLMALEQYAEACPKFAASHGLDPALGTLLNLAYCWKQLGKTASAWTAYREAASVAYWQKQTEREAFARSEAASLEPRLARMRINVTNAQDEGLELRRDGVLVPRDIWGVVVPVDPGEHRIEAAAPNRRAFAATVTVPPATAIDVDVPALETQPVDATAAARDVPSSPISAVPPTAPAHETDRMATDTPPAQTAAGTTSILPALSFGMAAGGVVALGVAGYFALRTSAQDEEARDICVDLSDGCSPQQVTQHEQLKQSARRNRTAAYISAGLGAAFLIGALALYLAIPADPDPGAGALSLHPSVALDQGAIGVGARASW